MAIVVAVAIAISGTSLGAAAPVVSGVNVSWERTDKFGQFLTCGYSKFYTDWAGWIAQVNCSDVESGNGAWISKDGDMFDMLTMPGHPPGIVYRADRRSQRRIMRSRQAYGWFRLCYRETYEGGEVTVVNRRGKGFRIYGGGLMSEGTFRC